MNQQSSQHNNPFLTIYEFQITFYNARMDIETRYNLALDYIYSFVDYSLKKADQLAAANFDLGRMRQFMAALGNPQDRYPSLHVAGTKGKGSVSALCASALTASGRATGLYTSPNLLDFTERIQIDGQPISHSDLASLTDEIKPIVAQIPQLTTFEITTALAFLYFSRQNVAAAVIEVGLGGRLDATNVITPRVSVITSLSYDHMAVLGDTLAKIAGEKAGIIKPGVPVVSAPQKPEALEVLKKVATERHADLSLIGTDILYEIQKFSLDGQTFRLSQPEQAPVTLQIPLLGAHQVVNAATAYAALQQSGLSLSPDAIAQGFANVRWPCRFEIASRANPTLIFDSAHNEDSFEKLAATINDYFPGRQVILIFGVSEDKHIAAMLSAIRPQLRQLIVARADHPRALEAGPIVETAKTLAVAAEAAESVEAGLARAMELSKITDDVIVSAGSMFLTAEVKRAWLQR
jgi:dihydrofolate synthase/folylpolyglutamate synthase